MVFFSYKVDKNEKRVEIRLIRWFGVRFYRRTISHGHGIKSQMSNNCTHEGICEGGSMDNALNTKRFNKCIWNSDCPNLIHGGSPDYYTTPEREIVLDFQGAYSWHGTQGTFAYQRPALYRLESYNKYCSSI